MKFSVLAATFLSTIPSVFALPQNSEGVDFKVKCCVTEGVAEFTSQVDEFLATFNDNISGYSSPLCFDEDCPIGFEDQTDSLCKTGTQVCEGGLGCCLANGEPDITQNNADPLWTCAIRVLADTGGDEDYVGGYAGKNGFSCGKTFACKTAGAVCGDPHIQTWEGGWYDFHGACDLVFVKDEEFAKGLGLAIHLRTTARYEYSYVETAALKIGDDILEVSAYGEYFLNGVQHAALEGFEMGGLYKVEYESADKKTHTFNIIISEKQKTEKIQIKTFKDLVSVKFDNTYENTFGNTVGMMGNYNTGSKLARDGKTVIEDAIEFGMEWQVRAEEPMLFQATRAPQLSAGEQCVMPTKSAAVERRRLGETVPLEAAVAACEAVDHIHHENCVYDVVATGDLEIAHAGVF